VFAVLVHDLAYFCANSDLPPIVFCNKPLIGGKKAGGTRNAEAAGLLSFAGYTAESVYDAVRGTTTRAS
jgi:hypothetical protein